MGVTDEPCGARRSNSATDPPRAVSFSQVIKRQAECEMGVFFNHGGTQCA